MDPDYRAPLDDEEPDLDYRPENERAPEAELELDFPPLELIRGEWRVETEDEPEAIIVFSRDDSCWTWVVSGVTMGDAKSFKEAEREVKRVMADRKKNGPHMPDTFKERDLDRD